MNDEKKTNITVLLQAGRLPLDIMAEARTLAEKHDLGIYLTTMQNLRLTGVPEKVLEEVKSSLAALGADFKGPGKFPIPRVCVGMGHCNLGIIDTEAFSTTIVEKFGERKHTKAKFKIAVAGCTMCCPGVKTSDIGIMATRNGYEVFVGGKGGPYPKIGRRIAKKVTESEVMDIMAVLVEFHDRKTEKKQRFHKLLDDPEFPFKEI
ncbi:MAG: nitrite reductase [Desulfobulbaceae bacterium BRH_c16a]|nr:MAG: nitrite reductase [Desulfobulbaceae bacterium BRH_c16a]